VTSGGSPVVASDGTGSFEAWLRGYDGGGVIGDLSYDVREKLPDLHFATLSALKALISQHDFDARAVEAACATFGAYRMVVYGCDPSFPMSPTPEVASAADDAPLARPDHREDLDHAYGYLSEARSLLEHAAMHLSDSHEASAAALDRIVHELRSAEDHMCAELGCRRGPV
jgi:hypothetical protein